MVNNLKRFLNLKNYSSEEKIKIFTLAFLLILWFLNPNNKLILAFFLGFLFCLNYLIKDLLSSLILTFFLSSFFSVGKTYFFQLLDLKKFPNLLPFYPLGLVAQIKLSVSDVIFSFLFIYLIRIFYTEKIKMKKINFIEFLLISFFIYGIFSDIAVSSNVSLSLLLKKELFQYIFVYFLIKVFIKNQFIFFKYLFSIIIPLVIFEIFIALQQFIYSSPIGKNLEATFSIEFFGKVPDEGFFLFRPIGSFFHANYLALFLVSIFPFFIFLIIKTKKIIYKFISFLITICLILTLSRAAWFIFLIDLLIVLFYFEYHKKKKLLKIFSLKEITLFFILTLPLIIYSYPRISGVSNIFQEGGGLNVRLKQTNEILKLISKSPFFGVGTGMSVVSAINNNPKGVFASFPREIHNYYLLIAAENGLPYLFLFILFLFFSFKKLINNKNDLAFVSFVSLISILFIGLFQPFIINQFLFFFLAFNYDKIKKNL